LAKLLSDYVKAYERALSPEQCQALIDKFEADSALHQRKQAEGSYSYVQLIGSYWPAKPQAEEIRLKRYMPDGRDNFPAHVDVMDDADSRRFVTAILYLNDPGGGETIFPGLDVRVPPVPGRLVVFPPLWLFPHAGLPPRDRPKYILHSYLWYPPADPNAP
jgi:hypothetical protein